MRKESKIAFVMLAGSLGVAAMLLGSDPDDERSDPPPEPAGGVQVFVGTEDAIARIKPVHPTTPPAHADGPDDVLRPDEPLPPLAEPSVRVEKGLRRLTLLDAGKPVKVYPVVVGEAQGDKRVEGDRKTPEGEFFICVKNPQSRYTLSLGLSYPDIEDAERGLREGLISRADHDQIVWAIRNGRRPKWKTRLGGAIMIHGGGLDREGTLGCVRMSDPHIRELYEVLAVGTKVVIVP